MASVDVGRGLCSILSFRADLEPALVTSSPVDCIAATGEQSRPCLARAWARGGDHGLLAVGDKTYPIVNADDFGRSPGVNWGIIEAHGGGIVTSASLMVRWRPAAAKVAAYAMRTPGPRPRAALRPR